ncbi:hypothetical protein [Streptomyces sp. NPDC005435]|uniref:hypothetical protein n=1 Tax=Streptomyces sp. NPDC005435 TaxID=3154464 RepID=UPI0034535CF7
MTQQGVRRRADQLPAPAPDATSRGAGGGFAERTEERAEERMTEGRTEGKRDGPADPAAARRRAERREQRVTAGVTELEQRLADLLRGSLASAEQAGYALWDETAARMVDAQAPGLATRIRELGAIPASGPDWPARLLEECALLHLLGQGWLRRDRLPDALAATVRSRLGLPATPAGPPLRDRWLVLAQYDTADPKLTTRRIWLHGTGSGHTRLLLSYGAAGRAPELSLPVGHVLEADLSVFPGAGQLRAALGERYAPPAPAAARPEGLTTSQAATRYGDALREDPWLDTVPVTLKAVVPVPDERPGSWQLADAEPEADSKTEPDAAPAPHPGAAQATHPDTDPSACPGTHPTPYPDAAPAPTPSPTPATAPATATAPTAALPLPPPFLTRPALWRLIALSGGTPLTVFGELGHRGFTPLTAWPAHPGPRWRCADPTRMTPY